MKLAFKLLLLILILAAAIPFTSFMPGGKPLLDPSDLKCPRLTAPELPRIKLPEVITKTPSANQRFYKWTDSDGNVHYSDQPPEPGVQSETVTVNPNTNVLAPLDMPKPAPQPVKRATADKSGHRPKAA